MIEKEKLVRMVTAAQKGDEDAVSQIFETFRDGFYYYILKTMKDTTLAEDLTQDTFVEIIEKLGELKEPAAFITWAQQIAYHRCTAYFRKRKELLADEDEEGYSVFDTIEEVNTEFLPDEALDKEDLKKIIHKMIDNLPREQRATLLMRYFQEIPVKEIAQIQKVSEGTVKSRLNYARKAIKAAVESYEKKNGIKLRCAGVVPLLLWFFRQYRKINKIALTSEVSAAAFPAAQSTFLSKIGGGIKGGVQMLRNAVVKKVVAGVVATAVVVGGAAVALTAKEHSNTLLPGSEFTQHIPREVVKITFTDQKVPKDVETIDVSAEQDGSVVAWMVETDAYDSYDYVTDTAYEMVVTTTDGKTMYANEDSNSMFMPTYIDTLDDSEELRPVENPSWLTEIVFDNFDTSRVMDMDSMFAWCSNLRSLDLSNFDISQLEWLYGMFYRCESLTELDVSNFDTANIVSIADLFAGCRSLKELDLSAWNVENIGSMENIFANCYELERINLQGWGKNQAESINRLFYNCKSLQTIEGVESLVTEYAVSADEVFSGCTALRTLNLSGWDTSNCESLFGVFKECTNLQQIDGLENWDTSSCWFMQMLFLKCESLLQVNGIENWNTKSLQIIRGMFWACKSLQEVDLHNWDTSAMRNVGELFVGCENLKQVNLQGWDTSNIETMYEMFAYCSSLEVLDLSSFDVSGIQPSDGSEFYGLDRMFYSCTSLETIFASDWTEEVNVAVTEAEEMFYPDFMLRGAVPYQAENVGLEMANPYTGYFTQK